MAKSEDKNNPNKITVNGAIKSQRDTNIVSEQNNYRVNKEGSENVPGIQDTPEEQRFSLAITWGFLVASVGILVVFPSEQRIWALVVMIPGVLWGVFVYQNRQNHRSAIYQPNHQYDMIITVRFSNRKPVKGALVTVFGPVPFTDKKTDSDGRVTYHFTNRDVDSYRNKDIEIIASYENVQGSTFERLNPLSQQHVELFLSNS